MVVGNGTDEVFGTPRSLALLPMLVVILACRLKTKGKLHEYRLARESIVRRPKSGLDGRITRAFSRVSVNVGQQLHQ